MQGYQDESMKGCDVIYRSEITSEFCSSRKAVQPQKDNSDKYNVGSSTEIQASYS